VSLDLERTKINKVVFMPMLASEGIADMGVSKGIAKSKQKALAKWFPVIAETAHNLMNDGRTASRLETVGILSDLDQVTTLFSSLDDWRSGQIVTMDTAFGDL
jgi:hypothetical protein